MQVDEDLLFQDRLDFLSSFVTALETQFGILEAMIEHLQNADNDMQAAIFSTVVPAIRDRLILSSAQLLDKNSGTNLAKTLNHYRANKSRITHLGLPLDDAEISALLDTEHLQSEKIRLLRDKALAHLDRQFTEDPHRFLTAVGLDFQNDISEVISHAQLVLSRLSMAVSKSARMSVGKIYYAAALNYFSTNQNLAPKKD